MATQVAEAAEGAARRGPLPLAGASAALRVAAFVGGLVLIYLVGRFALEFLRDKDSNRVFVVLVAIAVGVGGVFALFWAMDRVVSWLPREPGARACGPTSTSGLPSCSSPSSSSIP